MYLQFLVPRTCSFKWTQRQEQARKWAILLSLPCVISKLWVLRNVPPLSQKPFEVLNLPHQPLYWRQARYVYVRAQCFSRIQLFVTPWTIARQTPLSMGFSRQEYWSGLPFPPTGDLPHPGMEPTAPAPLALQVNSLLLSHQGIPLTCVHVCTFFPPLVCMTYSLTLPKNSIGIYSLHSCCLFFGEAVVA